MTAEVILDRLAVDGPRVLPRLVTMVENEDPRGLEILEAIYPLTGNAHVVGVTGPPGAGKSTLIAALVKRVREADRRVAVLAVDPSSPLTGGAVLGDRIRMMAHHTDIDVFVRSMASRGRQGGLAWATAEIIHVLDAAGFPLIIVETVGTGQDGTDIAALAETVVVVETPGLGDSIQAIKSGLLEVGDVVVVNKADKPGASDAMRIIRSAITLAMPVDGRAIPVIATDATAETGITDLLTAVDEHVTWLENTGTRSVRRERRARFEVFAGLRLLLSRRLDADPTRQEALSAIFTRVANRELTPRRAVEAMAARLATA